jgi:hypothetical protein
LIGQKRITRQPKAVLDYGITRFAGFTQAGSLACGSEQGVLEELI